MTHHRPDRPAVSAALPGAPAIPRPRRAVALGLAGVTALFLTHLSTVATPSYASPVVAPPVAAWPGAWTPVRHVDGTPVTDVNGDRTPARLDLASGECTGPGCAGPKATALLAASGGTAFFRVRVAGDVADAGHGGLAGGAFLTRLRVPGPDGSVRAVVGVDGTSETADRVYVADGAGGSVTTVHTWSSDSPEDGGFRVLPAGDGSGDHFVDYQVPVSAIAAVSDGDVTATTPVKLYYGSSSGADLAATDEDLMDGDVRDADFSDLATVRLAPADAALATDIARLDGSDPVRAGRTARYRVRLEASNPGGTDLAGATVTAHLPASVSLVSAGGDVHGTGATLTWDAGTLAGLESRTTDLTLDVTPADGMVGGTATLLDSLALSGSDDAVEETRTASAPDVAVGPIASGNSAPAAADDETDAVAGEGVDVDVLANDTDADEDHLVAHVLDQPTHGHVVAGDHGTLRYTADEHAHGADSFTYEACDPSEDCDTATVHVDVRRANHAPVAAADEADEADAIGRRPADGTVVGTDADGDALAFDVVGGPDHGTAHVDSEGDWTYEAADGYVGDDAFDVAVCDPFEACDTVLVTVHVLEATVARDFAAENTEDGGATHLDVAAHVTPVGPLATTVAGQPAHGEVVVLDDGSIDYTPDHDFHGQDTVEYRSCTPYDSCDDGVVTITVLASDDAPTAGDSTVTLDEDAVAGVDLTRLAADVDRDHLSFAVTTAPAHGSATLADGVLSYRPVADFTGTDTLTWTACDPSEECVSSVLTLIVRPVDDAPRAAVTAPRTAYAGTAIALQGTASDVDGDDVESSWSVEGPALFRADGDSLVLLPTDTGTVVVHLTVSDGTTTGRADARITVLPTLVTLPDPVSPAVPAGVDCANVTVATHGSTLTVGPACADVPGTSISVEEPPAHGRASAKGGTVTYVPELGFTGRDSFMVRVSSPFGSVRARVHVRVLNPRTLTVVSTGPASGSGDSQTPSGGGLTGVVIDVGDRKLADTGASAGLQALALSGAALVGLGLVLVTGRIPRRRRVAQAG